MIGRLAIKVPIINLQTLSCFYSLRFSSSKFNLNIPFPHKNVFKQSILCNSLPLDIRNLYIILVINIVCD